MNTSAGQTAQVGSARGTGGSVPTPAPAPTRIVIQLPQPAVDDGRYPAKRCIGDTVTVAADVFRDGHDILRTVVKYRGPGDPGWREAEMHRIDAHLGGVRWAGEFEIDRIGRWLYNVQAWTDVFGTWRDELQRKLAADQHDLASEMSEGIVLLRDAARNATDTGDRALLEHALLTLEDQAVPESAKHDVVLGPELFAVVERTQERHGSVTLEQPLAIEVDRVRAKFGAWYELFPRSWGGLRGVQDEIPHLAELGFDIVYLPPIHPIGHTNRKGANNALSAAPGDPGSPWAIGDETGGHDAIHPELGTLDDLTSLTQTAHQFGIDICIDFAIQCSADHPWLTEHPEWFHRRPDGTLKYAENPPKRYQDIYNVNWETPDWRNLWEALKDIVVHWVLFGDHGIPCGPALKSGERHQGEASGNEFKPEQHDHHEADGKDQRADQRLAGGDRAGECECGSGAEQRAGQSAADQEIARTKRQLLLAGVDHRGNDIGRFGVIHFEAPAATLSVVTTRKTGTRDHP